MSYGQGLIIFKNNPDPGTPPIYPVTGADNGLSLNGTVIELGGDLIKDTVIDLMAKNFAIINTGSLGDLNLTFGFKNIVLGATDMNLNITQDELNLGNFGSTFLTMESVLNGGNATLVTPNFHLSLRQALNDCELGYNSSDGQEKLIFHIDKNVNEFHFDQYIGGVLFNQLLLCSATNLQFYYGDHRNSQSGLKLYIDAQTATENFQILDSAKTYLIIDPVANIFGIGDWEFGNVTVAASTLDPTKYLNVNVAGISYKLALIS